eukprot:TRINITY_DN5408_c0_g1_i1.p1 TRINITY_DN5408_c0_g1~~TRINITY_DN5408_c0_g1_i1.p1  ORF type:complete len:851 (+),score=211.63 TRINITY_DN5408_c0_g1_i1:50-2602(+)
MTSPDVACLGDELIALYSRYEEEGRPSRDSGYWERVDGESFWKERFKEWRLAWPSGEPIADSAEAAGIRSRLEDFLRRAQPCDVSELDALLSEVEDDGGGLEMHSDSDSPTHLRIGAQSFGSAQDDSQLDEGWPQRGSRATVPFDEARVRQLRQAMQQELPLRPRHSDSNLGGGGGGLALWLQGAWSAVSHPFFPAGASAHYHRDGRFRAHGGRGRVLCMRPSSSGNWMELVLSYDGEPSASGSVLAVREAPPPHPPGWLLTCARVGEPGAPDRFPVDAGLFGSLAVALWRPSTAQTVVSPQRRRGGIDHGCIPAALEDHPDWVMHPASGLPLLPRGAWGGRLDRPDGLVVAFHAVPCSVSGRWGIRRPRRLLLTAEHVLLCSTLKGSTQVEAKVHLQSVTQVWLSTRKGVTACDMRLYCAGLSGDFWLRADKQRAASFASSLRRLQSLACGPSPPGPQRRAALAVAFAASKTRCLLAPHVALVGCFMHRELKVRVVSDDTEVPNVRATSMLPRRRVHFPWDLPVMRWDEVVDVLPTDPTIRFRLDAFYRTYTGQSTSSFGPSDAAKVDVLVGHVLEGRHPLDRVLDKMCEKHDAPAEDWRGRMPIGLVRFHLLAICRCYDPSTEGVPPLLPRGRIARSHVVDHLARKVCNGDFCLSDVIRRLCKLFGAPADDWIGEYPVALQRDCDDLALNGAPDDLNDQPAGEDSLRFLVDSFYLTISPGDIAKAAGLCDHVTSGRHPLRRVVAVMCEKYAANLCDWAGPCPIGPLRYRLDCMLTRYDPLYEGVDGLYAAGPEARAAYVEAVASTVSSGECTLESVVERFSQHKPECVPASWTGAYPAALRGLALARD